MERVVLLCCCGEAGAGGMTIGLVSSIERQKVEALNRTRRVE